MKNFFVVVCLIFSVTIFSHTKDADIEKGIALHNACLENLQKEKIIEGKAILKPYVENDMRSASYYGSLLTLEAALLEKSDPLGALALIEKGSSYLDSAVEKNPHNFEIRLVRLTNGLEVSKSSPVKRYAVIKDDVAWFESRSFNYDAEMNAQIFYALGLYYFAANNIEKALDMMDACLETKADTSILAEAKKILRRYEE